ncbi:RICIN domain-containing protein [Antribacter gilvus]|uniref:RICIN domain-containing protein n=1 Tax=Antribacter gilvus TaxID=2304675 RepID=UPI000F7A4882|nr:RICIN domain-containing protein [Antribacter gilvus]
MVRTTFRRRVSAAAAAAAMVGGLLVGGLAAGAAPAAAADPYAGYLFSYFTGEGTSTGERVYFALSRGNDPVRYDELNGGGSILTSTVGTGGVRDPFIIRHPTSGTFYQIATDLKMNGYGNWDAAQRTGSRSIVVWESTDLVTWSAPRLELVSPATAGNTWAPEAYWDDAAGHFVVFWASKLYATSDPNHTGSSHNRMMYATTTDFNTFTPAQVWKDPGYSVIDSTVAKDGGTYYRFTKDERSNTSSTPCGKFIFSESSTSLTSTSWTPLQTCIGKTTSSNPGVSAAEGPTIFKSNTENRWYLFLDEFGGQGYVPFTATSLGATTWTKVSSFDLPASPRHGTVLPVTQAEYDRLLATYGSRSLVARHSGKCADVPNQSRATGVAITQYTCNGGANQKWRAIDAGSGYVRLQGVQSGLCLQAATSRSAVTQETCDTGTDQQWTVTSSGGYDRVAVRSSGRCLDVNGASTANSAAVLTWTCNGATNQQWSR